MSQCHNCGNPLQGKYCTSCGQHYKGNERLTFAYVVDDFLNNILNFEKGFFFTFWSLLVRPGKVASEYIYGKRKKYLSPPRYFGIVLVLVAIIEWLMPLPFSEELISETVAHVPFMDKETAEPMMRWAFYLVVKYFIPASFVRMLINPVLSYVLFLKQRMNMVEHVSAMFYFQATWFLIFMTSVPVIVRVYPDFSLGDSLLIIWGYLIWASYQLFRSYRPIPRLLRSFLLAIGSSILWFAVCYILGLIHVIQ